MPYPLTIHLCLRSLRRTSSLAQSSIRQNSYIYRTILRATPCYYPLLSNSIRVEKLTNTSLQLNIRRWLGGNKQTCWKCGVQNDGTELFCGDCYVLQKPNTTQTHFNVIGVEQNYDINIATLTRKYYQLQNILHPDRFSNKPAEERQISEDYSALVNKAYFTLLNPLSRGLYILELNGIFIEEGKIQSSPQFLMEIMERNEEVDEAQDVQQLRELSERNKTSREHLTEEVSRAFSSGDVKEAEQILIKMKYYASIDTKIKELKQKKGFAD